MFSKPNELFKQQIKNLLNTKRSLFKVDEDNDNFYDIIQSYFSIYNFIREEMKVYDCKLSITDKTYILVNEMLQKLNEFLTTHQSNYKRWYEYMLTNKMDDIYNKDIKEIQRAYRHYELMISDFKELNYFFCTRSKDIGVDVEKWCNKI